MKRMLCLLLCCIVTTSTFAKAKTFYIEEHFVLDEKIGTKRTWLSPEYIEVNDSLVEGTLLIDLKSKTLYRVFDTKKRYVELADTIEGRSLLSASPISALLGSNMQIERIRESDSLDKDEELAIIKVPEFRLEIEVLYRKTPEYKWLLALAKSYALLELPGSEYEYAASHEFYPVRISLKNRQGLIYKSEVSTMEFRPRAKGLERLSSYKKGLR